LGERLNGIQEVRSSILRSSTIIKNKHQGLIALVLFFVPFLPTTLLSAAFITPHSKLPTASYPKSLRRCHTFPALCGAPNGSLTQFP
jgi:hypothetical protein